MRDVHAMRERDGDPAAEAEKWEVWWPWPSEFPGRVRLPYHKPVVSLPESRRGYWLLTVDIGDENFVEWVESRN